MAEAKKTVKPTLKAKTNAYLGTGRRKKAIARVRLIPNGNGVITINKKDIDEYFRNHELEMRNEVSILADYYKSTSGEYEAHLIAKDKGINLIDLTMSVPLEETAISICDNWQKKNQEIYQYLIEQLF